MISPRPSPLLRNDFAFYLFLILIDATSRARVFVPAVLNPPSSSSTSQSALFGCTSRPLVSLCLEPRPLFSPSRRIHLFSPLPQLVTSQPPSLSPVPSVPTSVRLFDCVSGFPVSTVTTIAYLRARHWLIHPAVPLHFATPCRSLCDPFHCTD